jgi:hypothetical protein
MDSKLQAMMERRCVESFLIASNSQFLLYRSLSPLVDLLSSDALALAMPQLPLQACDAARNLPRRKAQQEAEDAEWESPMRRVREFSFCPTRAPLNKRSPACHTRRSLARIVLPGPTS